jgi:hypothetical protein
MGRSDGFFYRLRHFPGPFGGAVFWRSWEALSFWFFHGAVSGNAHWPAQNEPDLWVEAMGSGFVPWSLP